MIELREPFPEYAWPQVWSWTRAFASRVEDDWAPKTLDTFVQQFTSMGDRARTFAVSRDGELGGLFVMESVNPHCGMVHAVFKKAFWGRTISDEAARLGFDIAFEELGKLSGLVFKDNHAVRAWYKRIGFREEGLLVGQTLRGGKPVDVVICGLTKEAWKHGRNDSTRSIAGREEQQRIEPNHDDGLELDVHAGPIEPAGIAGHHIVEHAGESERITRHVVHV